MKEGKDEEDHGLKKQIEKSEQLRKTGKVSPDIFNSVESVDLEVDLEVRGAPHKTLLWFRLIVELKRPLAL